MPTNPAPAATDLPSVSEPAAAAVIKVKVPQESGTITVNTFNRMTPYKFDVAGGLVEVGTKAEADLLLARVDGATLAS